MNAAVRRLAPQNSRRVRARYVKELGLLVALTRARSREVLVQKISAAAVEAIIAQATHIFFWHCGYRAAAEPFRRTRYR